MTDECQHKKCDKSNRLPQIMSTVAAIASAVAAILLLVFECSREDNFITRQTFLEIREHKDRMISIETAHTCAESIINFSEKLQASTRNKQGTEETVVCKRPWCDSYRHCTGSSISQVPNNGNLRIDGAKAWQIAMPVRRALTSYDHLALMACRNDLVKDMVFEEFKTTFRKNKPIFEYIVLIYPHSDEESMRQLPGLTALIGGLFPEEFVEWAQRWKDDCPKLP